MFVGQVIKSNGLSDGHYVEPYAGGAGIAIELLLLEYVRHIHLNDINQSVMAFWRSAIHETDALCRKIEETPLNMEAWRYQKAILAARTKSALEMGFAAFFLNRTNRSGIMSGGVIGGKDQAGSWKLDARFHKSDLIGRIRRIASYRSRIHLYGLDAATLLHDMVPTLPLRTLIYLDPPYYVKGRDLYDDHYQPADHEKIARLTDHLKHPWIVSYDDVEPIRKIYHGRRIRSFTMNYSAARNTIGSELMVFQDGLMIPESIRPTRAQLLP